MEKTATLNLRGNPELKQNVENVLGRLEIMSDEQFHTKLQKGYESYKQGRTQNAASAFE